MSKEQSELQVTIDLDDKVALKMLAVQRRTTVSAIVREWVRRGLTLPGLPQAFLQRDNDGGSPYVELWHCPIPTLGDAVVTEEEWVEPEVSSMEARVRHVLKTGPATDQH